VNPFLRLIPAVGVLALVAAVPCVSAQPQPKQQEWTQLMTTARKKVSLKIPSIRPHGEFVEAWTRYDYFELQNDVGKQPFRASNYLGDYDCKGRREKMRRVVSYNGPLEVHDLDIGRHTQWSPVGKPETVSGAVFEAVCAKMR